MPGSRRGRLRRRVSERALRDKAPYDVWIEQGHLNATPGKVIGFDYVAARLAETSSLYAMQCGGLRQLWV